MDVASATAPAVGSSFNVVGLEHATGVPVSVQCKDSFEQAPHIPYILNGELYEIQTQEGENVTVRCCHCPPDRVYRGSVRSTGNFHMHIKRRHPDLLEKLHEMKVTALVERRDRLMRNRKVSYRGSSRSSNRPKLDNPRSDVAVPQTMHKLKIKSAYQRHQLQQQQQQHTQQPEQKQQTQHLHNHAQSHKWPAMTTPFVVVPIGNVSCADACEPINYSIKSDNSSPVNDDNHIIRYEREKEDLLQLQLPSSQPHLFLAAPEMQQPPMELSAVNSNSTNFDGVSDITPCASIASSPISQSNYNSISVIKDALLMPEKAIDLSVNRSMLSMSSSGIGLEATTSTTAGVDNAAGSISPSPNSKWSNLLQPVEVSLREIQSAIHTRNQIESNRLLLEIAKFKYIHPGFHFQC